LDDESSTEGQSGVGRRGNARRGPRHRCRTGRGWSHGVPHWSHHAHATFRVKPSRNDEETAELVQHAGGQGIAVQVDHLDPAQVQALVARIEREQSRLDVLVNDVWGADFLAEWNVPVWEHSLEKGLRMLRLAIDTHIITSHFALPLLIKNPGGLVVEMTDGTAEYNNANYRLSLFYDLAKTSVIRMAWAQAQELRPHQCTAVALTPGWLRSEQMLDNYGVSEANWRDAIAKQPHFVITETPRYVGRAVAHLAGDPEVQRWSGQSLSSGQLAKSTASLILMGLSPMLGVREVQDAGKPANATGYR
jgi:NAD(P)-dependent dehydrogenase (short-subunit alcohol dehydrogenase family)